MLMPKFTSIVRWQNMYDRFTLVSPAEKRPNHLRLVICHIFDYTARSDGLCLPLKPAPAGRHPGRGHPVFPSKERTYDVDYR